MAMYTLFYLKWITSTYCIAHGTLLNVMQQPGWEQSLGENVSLVVPSHSDYLQPHGLYVGSRLLCSWDFSRQEYWNRLSFPYPGDLPDPGIKSMSSVSPALTGRFFTTNTTWETLGGEWIHVYESPFTAHLKLSQHC